MTVLSSSAPPLVSSLSAPTRVPALDAARGFALLIGVVFHGLVSLSFAKVFGVVQDTQGGALVDGAFYLCHIFRMQVFFLMSGYFAHLLYHRQGPRAFVLNRAKRLLVPFLLFWPPIYALTVGLAVWGIQRATGLSARQAFAKLPSDFRLEGGVPMMHLWFLYFLIVFCLCVVLARPVVERWLDASHKLRFAADRALAGAMNRWWGSLALACLMVGPMLGMTDGFGADTPNSSFWLRWAPFSLYGLYFALGWLLHRQAHLLGNLRRFRVVNLGFSVVLIGTLFALKLLSDPANPVLYEWFGRAINFIYAFASMVSACAFVGYMLAFFSEPHPQIRYLADSAYWGYLVHYPLIILFQILVAPYPWHWLVKIGLILAPTFLIVLVTYHFGVRNTWLGLLLNGRTYKSAANASAASR